MTIAEYIAKQFHTQDQLPFDTVTVQYKKGDVITAINQVEQNAYFLQQGLIQVALMKDGEERIIDFFMDNTFVCSYTSFLTQQPSDVEIACLTDCILEIMPRHLLINAYEDSLIANKLGRHVTEHFYVIRTQREKDFLLKTAEERYRELMEDRPELFEHLPVNKIAKYLGIHPESLSRIRKKLTS